ncbi:MAG: tyrosine--tRNA ligase [Candidatus Latescibacteria bacterium]|nr:tyrosine--tRNA ligase [Candidatus Latescibacterota bacterium]
MINAYDVLKERGFVSQVTDEGAVRKAFDEGPVTCYIGFDPTADTLHVGNLVSIMILSHLQQCGHKPIALIGVGTASIGDPSGKTELRQMLTREQLEENAKGIKATLSRYLDFDNGNAQVVNNADWLFNLQYIDFLREVGRHFSVNRMLSAEAYKIRMETGLTFLEFNYQILQSYDFLMLSRNHGCAMQMGGDDQWGNILAGVELIRRMDGNSAEAVTTPLVTNASGEKMGKTASGALWLNADRVSPYDYYQYWVNTDDRDVEKWLATFTFLPMEEVRKLSSLEGADLREAKSVLAFEATKITHGEEEAQKARDAAKSVFGGGSDRNDLPSSEIQTAVLAGGIGVIDLFMQAGLGSSKGEVRRLIQQGGASVNGNRVDDIHAILTSDDLVDHALLLRAGKKRYHRVVVV